ncbi:MAG: mechanosensitive ion channel domain-containing protein [Pirellulales bacterium]
MVPEAAAATETATTIEPAPLSYLDIASQLLHGDFSYFTQPSFLDFAEKAGLSVALVFIVMFTAWTASAWASGAVQSSLTKLRFDATLTKFLAKLVRWGVLLMATLGCLGKFGVETTSFAAVIGATGLAIGLAFQGTLSNFAAGAMLLIFRPYKVGDVVHIAGYAGTVDEIELFTTSIDTSDNRRIIIPNGEIFGAVIENITHNRLRRIDVSVGVSYSADIDRTKDVLLAALKSVPGIVHTPEPSASLSALGASSVDWGVSVWGPTKDYGAIKHAVMRAVKMHLDKAGIDIPFPQMDVRVQQPAQAEILRRAA